MSDLRKGNPVQERKTFFFWKSLPISREREREREREIDFPKDQNFLISQAFPAWPAWISTRWVDSLSFYVIVSFFSIYSCICVYMCIWWKIWFWRVIRSGFWIWDLGFLAYPFVWLVIKLIIHLVLMVLTKKIIGNLM